jgi:hypothetical protein
VTPHEVALVLGAEHAAAEGDLGAKGGGRVRAVPSPAGSSRDDDRRRTVA